MAKQDKIDSYNLTEEQARTLAKRDHQYYARKLRGRWIVWDEVSDHIVEFDSGRDPGFVDLDRAYEDNCSEICGR